MSDNPHEPDGAKGLELLAVAAISVDMSASSVTRAFPLADLDSLGMVCLVFEAESIAGAEWPPQLWESIETLGDVVDWIAATQAG
jgi:acyl carrier protein